jgi:hypothetical protein
MAKVAKTHLDLLAHESVQARETPLRTCAFAKAYQVRRSDVYGSGFIGMLDLPQVCREWIFEIVLKSYTKHQVCDIKLPSRLPALFHLSYNIQCEAWSMWCYSAT